MAELLLLAADIPKCAYFWDRNKNLFYMNEERLVCRVPNNTYFELDELYTPERRKPRPRMKSAVWVSRQDRRVAHTHRIRMITKKELYG